MNRNFRTTYATEVEMTHSKSDVSAFVEALLGESRGLHTASRKYELLEWTAGISDRHASELRQMQRADAESSRKAELHSWVAGITGMDRQRGSLAEFPSGAIDANSSALREAQWDASKHPRLGHSPNAGWFASTAGTASGDNKVDKYPRDYGNFDDHAASTRTIPHSLAMFAPPPRLGGSPQGTAGTPVNLARFQSSPTGVPSEAAISNVRKGKGVGHHWAPKSVIFDPEIRDLNLR